MRQNKTNKKTTKTKTVFVRFSVCTNAYADNADDDMTTTKELATNPYGLIGSLRI